MTKVALSTFINYTDKHNWLSYDRYISQDSNLKKEAFFTPAGNSVVVVYRKGQWGFEICDMYQGVLNQ